MPVHNMQETNIRNLSILCNITKKAQQKCKFKHIISKLLLD